MTTTPLYSPEDLKILVDALNTAPAYLSKRFVLKRLCGWSDDMIAENMRLKTEETASGKQGDMSWR